MSITVLNHRWAEVLLEALTRHGVRHICIAPGSRSTCLTLAAVNNAKFVCHTHFDERGLGHLALGLAKASGEPVAVIVTSGTAVANLYPAIIEAKLTGERLVILSADRPPELIDCGANQAIHQPGIFADHAQSVINLPCPTAHIPARWLVSTVDNAMAGLTFGALHINSPFAEPLYGEDSDEFNAWRDALGDWWQVATPWLQETPQDYRRIETQRDWPQWRQQRGVVIAGRMPAAAGVKVAEWAETLGWPLLGDVLSQTGQPLPCVDLWLDHPKAQQILAQADIVVQLGSNLTSKRLLQWQADCQPKAYWLIDPLPGRREAAHHRGRRLVADIEAWLQQHPAIKQESWAGELALLSQKAFQTVTDGVQSVFGDAYVAHALPQLLPKDGQLFVGNSLVVRLIDALAQLPAGYPVYSNRGASGIDGLISTAVGVQRATKKPTLAIVGDISALYDINALTLLQQCTIPTVLLVVNNNGGQIFSMLPTPEKERESFYVMPQNVSFAPAAMMFQLNYACPRSKQALCDAVNDAWQRTGATLIELRVPPTHSVEILQLLRHYREDW